MKLLTNPLVLRMLIGLVAAAFALAIGILLIRKLRSEIDEETAADPLRAADPRFPLETYHAVIERLKEQEKQLQQLRRAESERARASENISAALLSNLPSGVLLFNPRGLVQQANPASRNILGYQSITGLHARDVFRNARVLNRGGAENGAAPDSAVSAVEAALRRGTSARRLETEYSTPAGEERVLGLTVSPVLGRDGKSLGAACLISDLTEINRLSRQMRMRENLASLGEMSAGIAHEFKNSLATISGYAQMLGSEEHLEVVHDFARKIEAETGNLARVVTDFLAFARPQALRNEPVEVRAALEDCARACGVELHAENLPLELRLAGDPTALRQAFSNLLRNSSEAARNGTPVQVQVAAESGEQGARLTITDNGRGIPQEQLGKI
ncbi:MAG TPA: histidine kinase dimerization/phospho-acceptor domain-containing protein, partial [Terriglobales bacterium]|nr:histidine kinase dimerization/phospho-acceptor domain-containing protein [Terriglobales bacterium]